VGTFYETQYSVSLAVARNLRWPKSENSSNVGHSGGSKRRQEGPSGHYSLGLVPFASPFEFHPSR